MGSLNGHGWLEGMQRPWTSFHTPCRVNWAALVVTYWILSWLYWRRGRTRRKRPWPEEVSGVA
jgi:hypothetical protein